MAIPEDKKDRAAYHSILAEMHRLQSIMWSLSTIADDGMAEGLRDHFGRDQRITLGKLNEWRGRRPQIYTEAATDFAVATGRSPESAE